MPDVWKGDLMAEDKNEIVKIIEERIREAVEAEKKEIIKISDQNTSDAINRINGVYASILNTIKHLDIKEASVLEFYSMAGGRVRSINIVNEDRYEKKLYLSYGGQLPLYEDPIIIKPGKKYKVIFMAIEDEGVAEVK